MKRAIFVGLTTAALSLATAAQADEHVVLILPDAYFPKITYMDAGDTIRFINASGSTHNIIAKNDSWALGPIAVDAEVTMVIDNTIQKTFYDADQTDDNGDFLVSGNMSFASGPVN